MVSRGYIYTAFGKEYDRQCAYSAYSIRQHSSYPITVVSNLINHDPKWQDIERVNFVHVKAEDNENRRFKTRPYIFSPYDETLMLDTDILALRSDLEDIFKYLQLYDIAFPYVLTYVKGKAIPLIYHRALELFHCHRPLVVHQGGVCLFKRKVCVNKLFEQWHRAWIQFGRGREMQCLACMIQRSEGVIVGLMPGELYGRPHSKVIGHYYGKHRHKGLPKIRKNKFFNKKHDWVRV